MTKVKRLAKIREIPIEDIDEFTNHPYKVRDDDEMAALVESIRDNGVMTPAVVRRKKGGRYELLSGHRRKRACELLWKETLRCEIVEIDDDAAIIFMCDSNLYRTRILPSEKAFAYKMRLDAMKRQGKRNDLTCATSVHKFERSRNLIAKEVGESHETVRRYIRLTELIPEILKMVDEGEVGLRPAVEISYLPKDLQEELLDCMELEACTPNHAQTLRMRVLLSEGKLTPEAIEAIMQEEKPNQREKIILRDERVRRLLPKDLPHSKREEYIIEALMLYAKIRAKSK